MAGAEKLIQKVKRCAKEVYSELGSEWKEEIYQKAMEVALREAHISYETQRILPISYRGFVIGESIPDLVLWLEEKKKKKVAVVVDLKWDTHVKEDHRRQVHKYVQELRKQVKPNEQVFDQGFIINFPRTASSAKVTEDVEEVGGVQVMAVT